MSSPWDLFESFRFISPPLAEGLVLLEYRVDGKTYELTTRGHNATQGAPFAYAVGKQWTVCT